MKKLLLVACLAGILPAFAVSPTYVVPAETAGNVPEEPYDTWAKAANAIRTAATAAEPGGTVKIAAGDYSAATGGLADQHAVAFEAVDPVTDEPGVVTVGDTLLDHHGICPGDGMNRITLKKGCFTMSSSSAFYLETSGYKSTPSSNTVIVAGAGTKLVTKTRNLYVGYSMQDTCLKFTDHAVGEIGPIYVSYRGDNSSGATLVVESGACVTNNNGGEGQARFGYEGNNARLVVSNGTLRLVGQVLIGASAYHGTTVYVGGSSPVLSGKGDIKFLGDTATTVDMAEAPLDGYATPPISMGVIYYRKDCSFKIAGLDKLEERLVAANAGPSQWTILHASNVGTPTADNEGPLQAQMERIVADLRENHPHFTFKRTGICDFVVSYAPPNVYVVPVGTEGVTPTPPYTSWATASTNISMAADFVRSGTVTILEGTYDEARYTKDYPVVFKVVKGMDDPTPGRMVQKATMMGYGNRGWSTGFDRTAYFASGTFRLTPSSGNAFLEHNGNNGFGADTRPHFVATGKDTVIDASDAQLYIGYTAGYPVLELLDGARMYSNGAGVGLGGSGFNVRFLIGSEAAFTNNWDITLGTELNDTRIVISNGTLSTNGAIVDNDTVPRGTKLQFAGAKPLLYVGTNKLSLRGNAEVTFDVSAAALDGYKAIDVGSVGTFSDDVTFVLTGVDALKARADAADRVARLKLISSRNGTLPDALKAKLAALTLPEGCHIRFRGGDAVLCIGDLGLLLLVK